MHIDYDTIVYSDLSTCPIPAGAGEASEPKAAFGGVELLDSGARTASGAKPGLGDTVLLGWGAGS